MSVGDTDVWFVSDVTPVLRIALNICVKVHSFFLLVVAVVTHNDFWWCYGLASCPLEVQPGGKKITVLICSCDFNRWHFSSAVLRSRDVEWYFEITVSLNVHAM